MQLSRSFYFDARGQGPRSDSDASQSQKIQGLTAQTAVAPDSSLSCHRTNNHDDQKHRELAESRANDRQKKMMIADDGTTIGSKSIRKTSVLVQALSQ